MDIKTNVKVEALPDNDAIMNLEIDQALANLTELLYRNLYI